MKQLLKYILSQMLEHQKQAETKHSIGIALISAVAVVLINYASSEVLYLKVISLISLAFCFVALAFSFLAVSARVVSVKKYKEPRQDINYMYYKDIHNIVPSQYILGLARAYNFPDNFLPDNFELDLAKTIISTAQRAYSKNKLFNLSLLFLFISLLLMFFSGLLGGFNGILF